MSRLLLIAALTMITAMTTLFTALSGADSTADLRASSQAVRDQAQAQVEKARLRIADEHAALLTEFQTALGKANAARERLSSAEQEAKSTLEALAKRTKEHEREAALVKQLTDRVVIAAHLGEAIDRTLINQPATQRVTAALAGIDRRVAALAGRLGLSLRDEPIIARTGQSGTAQVLRLGEARAIALGANDSQRGLLERTADGSSWLVMGPHFPTTASTIIPLDATGTAAHQPGEVHRTIGEWLKAGRFFIWPIIAVFCIGVLIGLERVIALARRRVDPRRLVEIAGHLARGDSSAASSAVSGGTSPLDRVLAAGLNARGRSRDAREAAVEQALLAETGDLTRGLPAIAVLAGVAPLLGLLGTVTGMIDMFAVISAQGSGNAKSLSGGISEALICTQAGMLVAIPLLLLHAWLARLADRRAQILEEAACGMLGLTEHGDAPAPGARGDGVLV